MSEEYSSWRVLLEDFRMGYLNEEEAREHLDEMAYDLTDEELETAEDKLQEYVRMVEEKSLFGHGEFLDSVPWEDREDYEDYEDLGQWESQYDED